VGSGQWAVGSVQWAVGSRQWAVGSIHPDYLGIQSTTFTQDLARRLNV